MTTTAVTATAVTGGVPAGESADEDAGRAAAGDGRGHEPMRDLRRGVGSRRWAPAAGADRPGDSVLTVIVTPSRVETTSKATTSDKQSPHTNPSQNRSSGLLTQRREDRHET